MENNALSPSSHDGAHELPTSKDIPATAHALTPPTSEDMNTKLEDNSSDLSDLELDEGDDEEEIQPDHYYDGGKIPVFKPTMDQFRSFKKFIDKIDKYGMKSGIVKVIPPPEWRESLPALDELVKTIRIKNPIMQEFMGTHGTYTQANIEKQRSYNLPEWKALTEEPSHQPPARRGERRRNQEKVVRGGGNLKGRRGSAKPAEDKPAGPKRKPGRPRRNPVPPPDDTESGGESKQTEVPPTPTSPGSKLVDAQGEEEAGKIDPTPTKRRPGRPRGGGQTRGRQPKSTGPKGDQQKSVASRRMNNRTEAVDFVDEAAFKSFDYRMDGLEEYTPERCAELETAYWKSVTFAQPMYAADMPGSLFTDDTTSWNVAKLENLLDVLGTKVPGVNTAYLYLGMWKATFAWHLEDVDLYSINYIHFGAPKQWYSISQEDARKFEAAMKSVWPNDAKNCDQFLRHKTYLISPQLLESRFNIKVNKLVHHEGEFVITYPYGYHSGYNIGYNCAESVNFATETWLDYGRIARKCDCEADSVWVDVSEIERKLRGEPTPEYYEETDDDDDDEIEEETGDLPSPPASVAGKNKAPSRKRKRDVKEKDAGKKKKRIRIRIKAPTREPCVLCPNEALYEPLLPTDNGRKAHRSCALYTPETWIGNENGVETVCGITGIDRARLELKCNFCRSKRGACFQCASKKCTRAFHATCAAAAGVQIDSGMVPTFGEDGTEYFEEGYDLRCKFHRPKRAKNLDIDVLESSKLVNNYAKALKSNDVIQAQYLSGEIFAGLVVENRPSELSVVVDLLPEGDRVEVEWKWLVVLDPEDSLRPKPSANAIPMPEGMNKKSVSIENRQDGMPTMDEPFHDNTAFKWSEFINLDLPPNGYAVGSIRNKDQVKVDMAKPDSLYYYLPKLSSEARCKFTDDPKGKYPVARADFMDRARPAPQPPAQHVERRPPQVPYPPRPNVNAMNAMPRPMTMAPNDRPYVYKPKIPAMPNTAYGGMDPNVLAEQRSFVEAARRASYTPTPSAHPASLPPLRQQSSDPTQPLRPFPNNVYYSTRTLPAAFPGDYSTFRNSVRQESVDPLSRPQFPPYTQSPYGQQHQQPPNRIGDYAHFPSGQTAMRPPIQGVAPVVPMMSGQGSMSGSPPAPMYPTSHRDASSPPRPASSHAHPSSGPEPAKHNGVQPGASIDPGYVQLISHYPYLRNSFLRRAKVYESPYPVEGGFSEKYQPMGDARAKEPPAVTKTLPQLPAPAIASPVPSASAMLAKRSSIDWTPPSRMYPAQSPYQTPPQYLAQQHPSQRPQPVYQSPDDFQQQIAQQSNIANRHGAFDRMIRDMATFNPDYQSVSQPNGGYPHYSTSREAEFAAHSPKAPTPSPLSDINTPNIGRSLPSPTMNGGGWSTLPRPPVANMGHHYLQGGHGPPLGLPPMQAYPNGGHETWRYG